MNAAAVGLIYSALYSMIATTGVFSGPGWTIIAVAAFVAIGGVGLPTPIAVILGGVCGVVSSAIFHST